ncbi:MAG: FtsQ-type POTRA domain-containing protein [Propionibacteriaceae bacterium]|nr:FtsQ-type POTRA domain-containing protein [Propionibacteriaceae bacterium]
MILGAVAVAVVAGLATWVVFFSSALVLRSVHVEGTAILTQDEVLAQAQAPEGRPLARVNEREIAERVAKLPAVREVTVRRAWPRSLEIRVSERVPVFVIGEGDPVTLVDSAGATFRGPLPEGVPQGEGPTGDPALLADVARVVTALPDDLRAVTQQVTFTSPDAITIQIADDREIFFGSADRADLKAEVAHSLVRGTNATHIDVSAPTRPSTR